MQNKYHSEIAAAVHEDMRDMFKLGVVDKQTMRTFDELCLVPVQPMTAEEIRTLREREGLSQPVLAWYLNVSKNLISDWERGVRKPGGAALKLLNLVKTKGVQAISL
ncbi:MAG: DNA-binding transcriptional regulator [Desulfovibrio sp.]|uniref:helix-turn-helix domain-containing protein n=1 Tax=Desulfovibrio sp. TaxID=885 RepID=UPI00135D2BFA|nr:DNA-binding transcriptional regulator [Desulfovibrio sp.]MTJ92820.1 DNA-binding transcriptional regulator [Desulfovibrio sp.]